MRTETMHKMAMESLATESQAPIEQVEEIYQRELSALEAQARIKSFLPLLVHRRVRDVLAHRRQH